MTNRGAACRRSNDVSCILYLSINNLRNDEYSAKRPIGSKNFDQSLYRLRSLSRIDMYLSRDICLLRSAWSPVNHGCSRHSWAVNRFSLFLMSRRRMKSFPSSDTWRNDSSSKSQSHALTFFNVDTSLSPANGDRPLSLSQKERIID